MDNEEGRYQKLLPVIRVLLVLSHGQASVERGFSVNKKLEVENLKEQSLVGQRVICDYVSQCGGVTEVPITKELIKSVASARSRYQSHLEVQRQQQKTQSSLLKRKASLDELEELKAKRQCLQKDIDDLELNQNKLLDQIEIPGKSAAAIKSLATRASAFRHKKNEKRDSLKNITDDLKKVQDTLKDV